MPGRIVGRFLAMLVLLVVEVCVTMMVYTFLNLKFVDTFGYLVRLSSSVLEAMKSVLLTVSPGSANAAYATLLGELGPKAILLLLIGLVVAAIVRGGMDKQAATAFIRRRAAEQVSQESRARFVEVVETELMSLHDGNIARYRLRPSEYQGWRGTWS